MIVARKGELESEVLRLTQDLVALESHTDAPGREAAVGRFLVDWFLARGVDAELQPVDGGRANVFGRVDLGDGPTLLLNGHLDTVPAGGMPDAFAPRIEDGALWGRGTCDMKGAVAAMACVLVACAKTGLQRDSRPEASAGRAASLDMDAGRPPLFAGDGGLPVGGPGRGCAPLHGSLVFAGTVDEETGARGVKALVEAGIRADYAVVGEPTSLRVTVAHKGACFIRIAVSGRGAHGSCPEKGVSAASYGARILTALEDELRPRLAARTYPLLGASTVSVGRICGGTEPNIVAERCELDVDRRTLPGETDAVAEVRAIVAGICDNVGGVTYEVFETERTSFVPHIALGTPPGSRLAKTAAAACRDLGLPVEPIGVTYWTDGAHLAAHGIETIILGPGDIAFAHGPKEHVRIVELEQAAELYLRIAEALLKN